MKEQINKNSIIAGFIILFVGVALILCDLLWWKTDKAVWFNIGCSLIASSIVIIFTALFVDRKLYNPLEEWKIEKIYSTRAEKNADSDPELDKAKYQIDAVAFGLKSFRNKQSKRIETCLKNGVNIRILTMNPESSYISAREHEEQETHGQIQNTIEQLVKWANDFNKKGYKGKIVVKGYSCMTLDFYWRVDDELYIGPYWYGISSQQTITYKFREGGRGFSQYTAYFDELWCNDELCKQLTEYGDKDFQNKRNNTLKLHKSWNTSKDEE